VYLVAKLLPKTPAMLLPLEKMLKSDVSERRLDVAGNGLPADVVPLPGHLSHPSGNANTTGTEIQCAEYPGYGERIWMLDVIPDEFAARERPSTGMQCVSKGKRCASGVGSRERHYG